MPDTELVNLGAVKAYCKAKGINITAAAIPALIDRVKTVCDRAIEHAKAEGRVHVCDEDFARLEISG